MVSPIAQTVAVWPHLQRTWDEPWQMELQSLIQRLWPRLGSPKCMLTGFVVSESTFTGTTRCTMSSFRKSRWRHMHVHWPLTLHSGIWRSRILIPSSGSNWSQSLWERLCPEGFSWWRIISHCWRGQACYPLHARAILRDRKDLRIFWIWCGRVISSWRSVHLTESVLRHRTLRIWNLLWERCLMQIHASLYGGVIGMYWVSIHWSEKNTYVCIGHTRPWWRFARGRKPWLKRLTWKLTIWLGWKAYAPGYRMRSGGCSWCRIPKAYMIGRESINEYGLYIAYWAGRLHCWIWLFTLREPAPDTPLKDQSK